MKRFLLLFTALFTCMNISLHATPAYNDITVSPFLSYTNNNPEHPWLVFTQIKTAKNEKGFTPAGDKVVTTQYLEPQQNGLAMLYGAPADTRAGALAALFVGADDGVRGQFNVTGNYTRHVTAYFGLSYALSSNWWIGGFIPYINAELKDIKWSNLTQEVTAHDIDFHEQLGDDFSNQVEQLSADLSSDKKGLSLEEWKESGAGDLSFWIGWRSYFAQRKEWIKGVTPHIRAGMMLPTGKKKDEDKIFSLPFGNDGAPGIQVGLGLIVNLKHYVNVGIDIEFLHVFTTTRERRIKTDVNQTEALLLTKTLVSKDPGITERFTLFAEFLPLSWLQARLYYNFIKQSESHLYPVSNVYSASIANTALSLQSYTSHNITAAVDIGTQTYCKWLPDISVEYTHPFNGKRVIQADQISVGLSYNF